jgi:formate-dependent nitrite reductase membrane component NrfD
MELHWGWLIVIYLFLGGLGAGSYLTSYAAEKGWLGHSPALQRVGYIISGPIVAFGTLLLVFDLGQGLKKPWLLIGLLSNPRSVMTWGVYILAAFIMVSLVVAYFALIKKTAAPKILVTIGAVLALATCAYTGLLVAVVKAIPFWNTFLMPVLFVVSAFSTGLSITMLMAHILENGLEADEQKVTKTHLYLVGAEIVLLAAIMGLMASGSNGPVAAESASKVISGSLAISFWGILVALGLVAPLLVSVYGLNKLSPAKVGRALQPDLVAAVSEGAAASEGAHGLTKVLLLSDTVVVLGGFVLRYVVIFAAIPVWNGILN